jgi:TPR repeat protein
MLSPSALREAIVIRSAAVSAALAAAILWTVAAVAEPLPGQRERAEAGDVRAQYALAVIYDTGTGVPIDYQQGLKWFRLSAEGGYAPAQAKLGLMYLYGWAVRPDAARAASLYEAAARQGELRAQAQIATMYALGWGVPKDPVKAYVWTAIAAKAGDAQSEWRQPRWAKRLTADQLAGAETIIAAGRTP